MQQQFRGRRRRRAFERDGARKIAPFLCPNHPPDGSKNGRKRKAKKVLAIDLVL
jgi:hypothetical protein